jgi:hypothetical protein
MYTLGDCPPQDGLYKEKNWILQLEIEMRTILTEK